MTPTPHSSSDELDKLIAHTMDCETVLLEGYGCICGSKAKLERLISQEAADAQNELIGFVYRELGAHDIADKMKRYQAAALTKGGDHGDSE
jgi:hypothetical protein